MACFSQLKRYRRNRRPVRLTRGKTMKKSVLTILCCFLISIADGKLLMAQQWTVNLENMLVQEGYISEDNTVTLVGRTSGDEPSKKGVLMKLYGDGQFEWSEFPGNEEKQVRFESVLSLSDGGYFVVGIQYVEDYPLYFGELLVLVLDANMNVVDEKAIQAEGFDGFEECHSVMDDNGTVVVMATARRPGPTGRIDRKGVLFRFNQEGEILQNRYLVADPPDPLAYIWQVYNLQILNDPFSDRIVALSHGQNGIESVLLFDHEFNLLEDNMIADPSIPDSVLHYFTCCYRVDHPRTNYWYNESEMLISAHQQDTTLGVINHPHVLVGRMNLNGEITEKLEVLKQDTLLYAYGGMVYSDDTTVYVAARCHTRSFTKPFYPHVYLLSTDLELLGRIELWEDLDHEVSKVFATTDGGCVLAEIDIDEGSHYNSTFKRFSREDFHPISIAVKEMSSLETTAKTFPNPVKDELNIDLTGLSGNEVRRIRITDTSGRPCLDRIVHGEGNLLTLCLANLPSGIYSYVVYEGKNATISGKIVKE